ncbi:LmeA family phospholipid-binding protein [Nakamurella endophytica]|uniref:DUF2993 domain-containing protein n=1 Tax=Nakamurella endophytica TaxID=1748367 RepID=A0A917SQE2_9ACTN|nr:DUF2993 domain-containing protein [Nakamurella endophytica]GGL92939.1 hypothetical protein GCM10011594_10950 [Nakamurella endophytica]
MTQPGPAGREPGTSVPPTGAGWNGRSRTVALALSVVIGTLALLWVADWLSRLGAQSLLARSVQDETGSPERPSVTIHGTVFLLQVIRGRYDQVDVDIPQLSSGPLRLQRVHAELQGVHLPFHDVLVRNARQVVVDRATEDAFLSYDDLNRYLRFTGRSLTVESAGSGKVTVTGTVRILGREVSVSADATLAARGDSVAVTPGRLHTDTSLDRASEILLGERLTLLVPLDPLPFGQLLTSIRTTEHGLQVQATGTGVVLAS